MRTAPAAAAEALIGHHEQKRRTGRRTRWAVLLVPAVLILVALTSRRISMFGAFDDDWDSALDADVDGIRHEAADDGLSPETEVVWRNEDIQQQGHHRHKRQTLSLSNPAVPSSSDLITESSSSSPSSSDLSSSAAPSETASPTTTVPQTEQTIPPVPDSSNPPVLPTPFPQPYDTTGATSNLTTQACVNFFTNMTQAKEFRTCRPFSLLEYYSSDFIEVSEYSSLILSFLLTLDYFFSSLYLFIFLSIFFFCKCLIPISLAVPTKSHRAKHAHLRHVYHHHPRIHLRIQHELVRQRAHFLLPHRARAAKRSGRANAPGAPIVRPLAKRVVSGEPAVEHVLLCGGGARCECGGLVFVSAAVGRWVPGE